MERKENSQLSMHPFREREGEGIRVLNFGEGEERNRGLRGGIGEIGEGGKE